MKKMFKGVLLFFVLGVGVFLVSNLTQAAPLDWTQVNENGFGDEENISYSSGIIFNDYIYVGTSNDYEGAEIWRSHNGTTWEQIIGNEVDSNNTGYNENGFGNREDDSLNSMIVFNDYLYVALYNPTATEVGLTGGVKIWRTADGISWAQVNEDGFGESENQSAFTMSIFNSNLYVSTYNNNGTQIWRTTDGTSWVQVNEDGFGDSGNDSVKSMIVFNGQLYAGVYNTDGIQIWHTTNGISWDQIDSEGLWDDNNTIPTFVIFNDILYMGTYSYPDTETDRSHSAEIWRTSNGTTWEQIIGNEVDSNNTGYNENGFGNYMNSSINNMIVFDNRLYVATTKSGMEPSEIWGTADGISWTQINGPEVLDERYYNVDKMTIFNNQLYLGIGNNYEGLSMWLLISEIPSSDYEEVVFREKSATTTVDTALTERLSGRILIQTEAAGEAWYVNPTDKKKYYLGRPSDAFRIMRETGLGITNANLNKVPANGTSWTINQTLKKYVIGRILIQTEEKGEAWYVSPVNEKRYYMGRPTDAFQLMRNLGLGISNTDLRKIEVGE